MTLRSRNKFYLIFFIVSLIFLLIAVGGIVYLSINNLLHSPAQSEVSEDIFSFNLKASIAAVLIYLLFVPTATILINFGFEKTPSDETVFFLYFLICCFFEGLRLFFPAQEYFLLAARQLKTIYPSSGLPVTSTILTSLTKLMIYVRTLSHLSLLCIPIYPLFKKYLSVEELSLMAVAVSIVVSILVKIKVSEFQPFFLHSISGKTSIFWALSFVIASTFLLTGCFLTPGAKKRWGEAFGYLFLVFGHCILGHSFTIFNATMGGVMMFLGTFIFLRNIHSRLSS